MTLARHFKQSSKQSEGSRSLGLKEPTSCTSSSIVAVRPVGTGFLGWGQGYF